MWFVCCFGIDLSLLFWIYMPYVYFWLIVVSEFCLFAFTFVCSTVVDLGFNALWFA